MPSAFEEPLEHPQRAREDLRLRRLLKNRIQDSGKNHKNIPSILNPALAALFLPPV
jgi:hypothetical protein